MPWRANDATCRIARRNSERSLGCRASYHLIIIAPPDQDEDRSGGSSVLPLIAVHYANFNAVTRRIARSASGGPVMSSAEVTMPLYYFHCRDAQNHASATYGIDCPHLVAAHIAALDGALSMIADARKEYEFPVVIEIDDEDGRPLLQAPLSGALFH